MWVIVSECVTVHAHAYSLSLQAPSRTSMNQRYKLAPWKTSYESSCLYFSPTEPEDNSGWWNTLQSEHQACCSHSQWARYYRTHNYSQPLNLPCRQLDWRLLAGLLYSGRLLSLCAESLGSTSSCHMRIGYLTFIESDETEDVSRLEWQEFLLMCNIISRPNIEWMTLQIWHH